MWAVIRRRWPSILGIVVLLVTSVVGAGVILKARAAAHTLLTNPIGVRQLPGRRPIDLGLVFDELTVRSSDGLSLAGWYIPTRNGAVVMAQHGYKSQRGEMLNEAVMLHRHGYGVLITTVRAHDMSDGTLITFGMNEMKDLAAWYAAAKSLKDVDPTRIAMLGNSMGGSLVIQFAAMTPTVRAVVANSAFSSLKDTVEKSVRFYTGLPSFPFAPLITFWAEREGGFRAEDIDATRWIARISPRPVLIMQGGADVVISTDSGRKLFEAAGGPKELWFEEKLGHARFDTAKPDEYERRVTAFLDTYLLH